MLLVALGFTSVFAQKAKLDRANSEFKKYNYETAIPLYLEVLDKADIPEAKAKLAEAYRRTDNWQEAEYWYGQIVNLPDAKSIYYLYYGMALQANNKCDLAKEFFKEYNRLEPDDQRGALLAQACTKDELEVILNKCNSCYEIQPVPINTKFDDFGPVRHGKGLVFTSERDENGIVDRIHEWTGYPFLELFYTNIDTLDAANYEFTYEKDPKEYTAKLNTKFHDGPIAFSADQQKVYVTRNNFFERTRGRDDEGVTRLKIFIGEKDGENWDNLVGLPFNSDEYSVAHPSVSDDGKTLYFSSDMPGGFGGMDLYSTTFEDGAWGPPVNLGPVVNTEGHEVFPYYHSASGKLYFSSDGQIGLGALDIYMTTSVDNSWATPSNVGAPLNTKYDDHSIILNDDETFGYFSSNRPGGQGRDDIYSFRKKVVNVEILVFDQATNDPIATANVFNDCSKETLKTGANGKVIIEMPLDECCKFFASKEEYQDNDLEGCTNGYEPGSKMFVKIPLSKPYEFNIAGVITDKITKRPIGGAKVILENDCDEEQREFTTSWDGKYFFNDVSDNCCFRIVASKDTLSEFNKNYYLSANKEKVCTRGKTSSLDYQVDLELEPVLLFVDEEEPGPGDDNPIVDVSGLNKTTDSEGRVIYTDPTTGNVIVYTDDEGDLVYTNHGGDDNIGISRTFTLYHIYYDFDKSYIRDDAQEDLDRLYNILAENPKYIVEIGSHTDARGSNRYNEKLSQRRAKAVVAWLVDKGIPQNRLTYAGYGENNPTNDCINEVPCTEEEHQRNRRTEFRIVGTTDGVEFDTVRESISRLDVRVDKCTDCPF